jgi:hypothetical protein
MGHISLAFALGAGIAALGFSGPAIAFPLDLALVEHADGGTITDVGAAGDSVGDLLTFHNHLFDAQNQFQVGEDNGSCIRTVVGKTWECAWTTILGDGQITVKGSFYDVGDSTFAVTGGTGNFAGVYGELVLHRRDKQGSEMDFRFYLNK